MPPLSSPSYPPLPARQARETNPTNRRPAASYRETSSQGTDGCAVRSPNSLTQLHPHSSTEPRLIESFPFRPRRRPPTTSPRNSPRTVSFIINFLWLLMQDLVEHVNDNLSFWSFPRGGRCRLSVHSHHHRFTTVLDIALPYGGTPPRSAFAMWSSARPRPHAHMGHHLPGPARNPAQAPFPRFSRFNQFQKSIKIPKIISKVLDLEKFQSNFLRILMDRSIRCLCFLPHFLHSSSWKNKIP